MNLMDKIPYPYIRSTKKFGYSSVGIVGSRSIRDDAFLFKILNMWVFTNGTPKRIITADKDGSDEITRRWARLKGIPCITVFARWKLDEEPELMRNTRILNIVDYLIGFPTKESKESWDVIRMADIAGIEYKIYHGEFESDG